LENIFYWKDFKNLNLLLEINIISLRYRYYFSDTDIDTDTKNIDTSIDTSGIENSPEKHS
jgi:hypothetical protein